MGGWWLQEKSFKLLFQEWWKFISRKWGFSCWRSALNVGCSKNDHKNSNSPYFCFNDDGFNPLNYQTNPTTLRKYSIPKKSPWNPHTKIKIFKKFEKNFANIFFPDHKLIHIQCIFSAKLIICLKELRERRYSI